ncbi:heterokaryon incompatibility [Elaphomyces granulatus]|jgi:hypothetical protein
MRLLKVNTNGRLSLIEDLPDNKRLKYTILSYTWGKDDDKVMFKDIEKRTSKEKIDKIGYKKVSFCAEQAIRDDIQYIWVDTCYIYKSYNNTNRDIELQTAINSIFRWYQNTQECYIYLEDVPDPEIDADSQSQTSWELSLQKSRWFTRRWTL